MKRKFVIHIDPGKPLLPQKENSYSESLRQMFQEKIRVQAPSGTLREIAHLRKYSPPEEEEALQKAEALRRRVKSHETTLDPLESISEMEDGLEIGDVLEIGKIDEQDER